MLEGPDVRYLRLEDCSRLALREEDGSEALAAVFVVDTEC